MRKYTRKIKEKIRHKSKPEVVSKPTLSEDVAEEAKVNNLPANPSPIQQVSDKEAAKESSKRNFFWDAFYILAIILAVLASFYMYNQGAKTGDSSQKNPVSISSALTPVPSISPAVSMAPDLSKYKIKVLNGSGIEGDALKIKDILENNKFIVDAIGNADRSDYSDTVIDAKSSVSRDYINALKRVLENSLVVSVGSPSSNIETADIILIIGKTRNQ